MALYVRLAQYGIHTGTLLKGEGEGVRRGKSRAKVSLTGVGAGAKHDSWLRRLVLSADRLSAEQKQAMTGGAQHLA